MSPEFLADWLRGVDEAARPSAVFGLGVMVDGRWTLSQADWAEAKSLAAAGPEAIASWFRSRWAELQRSDHWRARLTWSGGDHEAWEALRAIFDAAAVSGAWRELARHADSAPRAGRGVDLEIRFDFERPTSEAEAVFRWLSELAWKPGSGIGGWYLAGWRWGADGRSSWHWPLRLGFLADEGSQMLVDAYRGMDDHSWVRKLSVAVEVERLGLPCDLLLSPLDVGATEEALRRARTEASAVLLVGADNLPGELSGPVGTLKDLSNAATVGFIARPLDVAFVVELVRHLSHDDFLDAALARTCEGSVAPPVIASNPHAMVRTRISRLGGRWSHRLERRGDASGAARMRSVAESPFLAEDGAASAMLEVAESTGALRRTPRYLNAGVWALDPDARWQEELDPAPALHRNAWSIVAAGLGSTPPRESEAVTPFPDESIDWDGVTRLTIAVAAPGCDVQAAYEADALVARDGRLFTRDRGARRRPVLAPFDFGKFEDTAVGEIAAGETGGSSLAAFFVRPRGELETFKARILVMHGNRVLQTAILEGAIDDAAVRPPRLVRGSIGEGRRDERPTTIRLRTEGVVRADLGDLDDRRPFDLAILTNDSLTGDRQWTAIADGQVMLRDFGDLEGVPARIQKRLQQLVYEPERFAEPGCEASTVALKQLANEGVLIRDALKDAGLGRILERDPQRIQLVSAKPDAILPIEFVYDGLAPEDGAVACPGEAQALAKGDCGQCPHRASRLHICAMRFWGVRKVIERQLYDAASAPDRDTVAMSPSPAGRPFARPAMRLFACADRAASHPAGADAIRTLCARLSGATAGTWDEWRERIAKDSPGLLLLLPHTDSDENGEYLEIGTGQLLGSAQIACDVVGSEEPVLVVLLGCETAAADISYAKFIGRFRHARASVVIGTLMPVLGRHAAPVAESLLAQLEHYWERPGGAATVGDAIAAMRRDLLEKGLPVGLAVVAIGDADWLIGG
ncbi:MAG: hypothetical protein JO013_06390 [Alphaproteobacteria bacterium]|nr:hypothetical protein [Alphaproteobacteria bacterium]